MRHEKDKQEEQGRTMHAEREELQQGDTARHLLVIQNNTSTIYYQMGSVLQPQFRQGARFQRRYL